MNECTIFGKAVLHNNSHVIAGDNEYINPSTVQRIWRDKRKDCWMIVFSSGYSCAYSELCVDNHNGFGASLAALLLKQHELPGDLDMETFEHPALPPTIIPTRTYHRRV